MPVAALSSASAAIAIVEPSADTAMWAANESWEPVLDDLTYRIGVNAQLVSQPSPFTALPSSHCSLPSTTPLPQISSWHAGEHPSPADRLPSSHCSPGSRRPL